MDLTTVARVKLAFEKALTVNDTALAQLVTEVSASAERVMNRAAQTTARTVYHDSDGAPATLSLEGYGDPSSVVSSVSHDTDRAWGSGTAIDAGDYTFDPTTGLLYLDISKPAGRRTFKVVYSGGMAADTTAFIARYPEIAQAIEQQVVHLWQQRGHLGVQNVSFEGGSIGMAADGSRWLTYVLDVLKRHKRFAYAT